MRKKLLDAPPEAGAIQTYTSELSRRLRHALPGERADEIVREAEAHLHDQADAIAANCETNVPRQEAEAQAVAAFTPPVAFARDMAHSAVETRFSRAWFATGKVVTTLMLCGLVAGMVFDGTVDFHTSRGYSVSSFAQIGYATLWPVACLCAFLARRAQTARLLSVTTLIGAFVFIYTGFLYVIPPQTGAARENPISRLSARNNYKGWRDLRLHANRDEKQLLAGLQIYRLKNPIVPAEWKTANGKGYIVPNPIIPNVHLAHTRHPNRTYYFPLEPSYKASAKTLVEARARWMTDGPAYLAQARYEQNDVLRYEEPLRIASQQTSFDAAAGQWCAVDGVITGVFLMLFDWLFAKLGRTVYAKRRARRERKASHA